MSGNSGSGLPPKEYDQRTLNAARLYSLLRQECDVQDPWHIMVVAVCSFEQLHAKDGWEFVLANKQDIEDVGQLFEKSGSPEEFAEGLRELKELDLIQRQERKDLRDA